VSAPAESPTDLLLAWGNGERAAFDRLLPLVSHELRQLAGNYLHRERARQTPDGRSGQERANIRRRPTRRTFRSASAHDLFSVRRRLGRPLSREHARAPIRRSIGRDDRRFELDGPLNIAFLRRSGTGQAAPPLRTRAVIVIPEGGSPLIVRVLVLPLSLRLRDPSPRRASAGCGV
jgi:hypothetical protein